MVVIRRELPRTRVVGQAGGLPHRSVEGSPFRVRLRPTLAPLQEVRSPSFLRCAVAVGLRCATAPALLLLVDLDSNGPYETEQLAADGGGHLLPELALGHETPEARA